MINGCSITVKQKKNKPANFSFSKKKEEINNSIDYQVIAEREAKLIDIPVPFNVKPLPFYFSQDLSSHNYSLGYSIHSSPKEIKEFYLHEMDRLGWKNTFCIFEPEYLIGFEKPTRFCIISLRTFNNSKYLHDNNILIIFTGRYQ